MVDSTSPPRADVVLLHGMWGCGETLDPVAAVLRTAGYRTFQPTLPGHGPSLDRQERRALGKLGIRAYTDWLQDYVAGLDLSAPPILLGHSMGGLLAQHLAARIPSAALVLLAPACPAGINIITPRGIVATSTALLHCRFGDRVHRPWHWLLDLCFLNDLPRAHRRVFHDDFLLESGQSYVDIVFWFLQRERHSAVAAERITAPMLILAGTRDRVIRAGVTRRIARRYPQAILEFLPRRGHMLFLDEDGHEVGERVVDWLAAVGT
jgi:pimeloyl-ACP methyl ester carboxylesterase